MASNMLFTEHVVPRGTADLYVRDYPGNGPAFVLMHGFPDHLGIYDDLIPHLIESGRRIVTFDFLGFGASGRLADLAYGFAQQQGDLDAVIAHLGLGAVVLVPHDSSGIAAINFAIDRPDAVAGLCILNSAFDAAPTVLWPEMITLFADPTLQALAGAIAQDPAQFRWLLDWQRQKFADPLSPAQKAHFAVSIGPLIAENFTAPPSAGPAFMRMASQFFAELQRNSARLPLAAALDLPVKVIWGIHDPYLGAAMGEERAALFRNGVFRPVPAGHWLQADEPALVARELLS